MAELFYKQPRYRDGRHNTCKTCFKAAERSRRIANPGGVMIRDSRKRAKQKGLPHSIKVEDLTVPKTCPCCGIAMWMSVGSATDNSPSLDRVIPSLGYVPENVIVVCNACNRRKNDATPKELYVIADFFYALIKERGLTEP